MKSHCSVGKSNMDCAITKKHGKTKFYPGHPGHTLLAFMTIDVYEHTSMPLTSCSEENTIMLLNIRGLKNIKKILIAQGGE